MSQPIEIKEFLLKNIPDHPKDIVSFAARRLNLTRTTIHRHLNTLINQQMISRTGTTKQATYYLANHKDKVFKFKMKKDLNENEVWQNMLQPEFNELPINIQDILHYGFTEVFNNVLDHAFAKNIVVSLKWTKDLIRMTIEDNGVGVFERLNRVFHYQDYREALLHLTKGKLTSDPINHTGEGLFFTARVFDYFYLIANGICFFRNNQETDWAIQTVPLKSGTQVIMELYKNSTRKLIDVFEKYTDNFEFNKTDLLVGLSQLAGERLISRSQAKRLFSKIEPFKHVILDFAHVAIVGQGFVDEVFRVYPSKHPHITIRYINANNDVAFMIKRSLS